MAWFYISFATYTEFLGATVLWANDPADVVKVATARGHNPGGEAAILEVPAELDPATVPDLALCIDRLATESELISVGAKKAQNLSPKLQQALEDHVIFVCEDCNR